MTNPTNHSPQGEGEANEAALRQFPNGIGQDGIFDMLQEARREGFIYGANWKVENKGMQEGFIPQLKKDAGVIDADKVHDDTIENMKWVKFRNKPPKGKVFAMLHGKMGLLHVVDKYSVLFDCGGEGWRYDMTDKTVQDFKWLDQSSIPADTVGIKCKNITTGKLVTAYHVDKSGAAHNKSNTKCIGCIGVDLIPIDVTAHSPAQGKGEEKAPNSYYQPLFDLLNQEHGLLPLETEMRDIVEVVNKMQAARAPAVPVSDAVEFAEWIIKNNYYHVSDKYESYWCAFGGEYITKDTTELYTLFLKH